MNKFYITLFFYLISFCVFSQNLPGAIQEEDNKIYTAVEQQAVPKSGIKEFYSDFVKEYKTPEVDKGVDKVRLMISFVIEKDGSLSDLKILRDGGLPQAATEALRVLSILPKWKPAFQNGREVRSQFLLPLTIQVEKDKKPFRYYLNK